MEATGYLRPAAIDDLIDRVGGTLIENRSYFVKYPDGHFEGPFEIGYPDTYIIEVFSQILHRMVYVPYFREYEGVISSTFHFRRAVSADFTISKQFLRYGLSYYLLLNGQITGAYLLTEETNVEDLNGQIKSGIAYVLEHKSMQHFPGLNPNKKAS